MKQVVQSLRTGDVSVIDVPVPITKPRHALVRVGASLLSSGTERMVAEFAEKSLLDKARSRPDLARQVIDKAKRDGPRETLEAAFGKLDEPFAPGYSCAGTVVSVGEDVPGIKVGDGVACAGGGSAVHAEYALIPRNLLAPVSHSVATEEAAFATIGAIALHGIRLAEAQVGETVAVIGLGLLGQLTSQILKASGTRVLGFDLDARRSELAVSLGAEIATADLNSFLSECLDRTEGRGADSVIITADTSSNEPIETAARIARHKGTVVAVGAVGLTAPRKTFYEKELDLRVSRSYGPGRYDRSYEEEGVDYPPGYVRWTIQRNLQTVLQLMETKAVTVQELISHRFSVDEAADAYDVILGKASEPFLGVLLTYPVGEPVPSPLSRISVGSREATEKLPLDRIGVGVLGAGNFAKTTLLPVLKKVVSLDLLGVCTSSGISGKHAADRFSFRYCTTDENDIYEDPAIQIVAVLTQHHHHARQVIEALKSGKHVYCEKPLCLTSEELGAIVRAQDGFPGTVTVGFNRRFAPYALALKDFLSKSEEQMMMDYRVNAGFIAPDHWIHDPARGGGRIVGEVCHFIDFLVFLTDSLPKTVYARALPNQGVYQDDNVAVIVQMSNGSIGEISYFANGDRSVGKEFIHVTRGGRSASIDDWRKLTLASDGKRKTLRGRGRRDKGFVAEWETTAEATKSSRDVIPFDEVVATTLATFAINDSLTLQTPITLDVLGYMQAALAAGPDPDGDRVSG